MGKMQEMLMGKKTYAVAVALMALEVGVSMGYVTLELKMQLLGVLTAMGLTFSRVGSIKE